SAPASRSLSVSQGVRSAAQKIVIYGPGGVGKTELVSLLSDVGLAPLFIDIEEGSNFLDVARIDPTPETFEEILQAIQLATAMPDYGAIVIDSLTKAEELGVAYTLQNVSHEKGHPVNSIEGYGWGKGYVHNFETFLRLLQALDAAARAGKHIIGICHDCTASVPNPAGEDWIRYEPRLQSPPSGKGSIRHRVKEWCDHLLYVGFDTFVDTDGKASGSGTRTIYPVELPTHWAKSRSLTDPVVYEKGSAQIWKLLFSKE
ncbi:hypothetical protein LCGC14_1731990, partial [marine sediment metagenome]